MTVRASTMFKQRLLGRESFKDIFDGGQFLVYSGAQPASADQPASGTLLGAITTGGAAWAPNASAGGLVFQQSGPYVLRDVTIPWLLKASAAGVAGWFRLMSKQADDNRLSFDATRLDGSVGTGGVVDMVLANTTLTVGMAVELQQFYYTFLPLGA